MTACASWDSNGNTTDYINMGAFTATKGLTAMSWVGWVRYNGSVADNTAIDSHRSGGVGAATFYNSIQGNQFRLVVLENGFTTYISQRISSANASVLVNADEWFHMVWTWTAPNTFTAYINGISQSTAVSSSGGTMSNLYNGVTNNNRVFFSLDGGIFFVDANLSNIAIYNRVISQNEVLALKENPESIVNGRVSYVPFLNTTVTDSITGATGSVTGSPAVSPDGPPISYSQGACS